MSNRNTIEQALFRHLATWRAIFTTAGETRPESAEQAVRSLYRRLGKEEPEVILWCDSPYQMAVVPPLVATVVNTPEWRDVRERISRCTSLTEQKQLWRSAWMEIEQRLGDLFSRVLRREVEFRIDSRVCQSALDKTQNLLQGVLLAGNLKAGVLKSRHPKELPSDFRMPLPNGKFLRYMIQLSISVHTRAEIKLLSGAELQTVAGIPSAPVAPDQATERAIRGVSIARAADLGVVGIRDTRLITELVPGADRLLKKDLAADTVEMMRKIKTMCADLERVAQFLFNWFVRLPSAYRKSDQEISRMVRDRFSDLGPGDVTLEVIGRVMRDGLQTFREAAALIREDSGSPFRSRGIMWFPCSASWLPFALTCSRIFPDIFGHLQEEIELVAELSHSASGYLFLDNATFACRKPVRFETDDVGRPHCIEGPAAVWADGYEVYSFRGMPVEPSLIAYPEQITLADINNETNVERRRLMLEIYGEARYLQDSGAELIHCDKYGSLYRIDLIDDEPLVMVQVVNSTREPDGTYKHYYLRVPPTMTRARQAVAWTFGMDEFEYQPDKQS